MEKWKTTISGRVDGELIVRGNRLGDLIEKNTFIEMVFLLWRGPLPSKEEEALLNAMLVAAAEHGLEAPSTYVARTVASTGNSFSAAIASGILTIGDFHGGAIEQAAELFASEKSAEEIVGETAAAKSRIPGYGHKVYKDGDPRTKILFAKAESLGKSGQYVMKARAIEAALAEKKLPLNIDGALAALLLELGLDPHFARPLFILARTAGLAAHAVEEKINEKPYRRLAEEDTEYIGS